MRVPESRLMPSVTVVMRGTEGPAGMIRTHAGSATGCPSHTISTCTMPVRKPSGSATFTCAMPSFSGSPMYIRRQARPSAVTVIWFKSISSGRFSTHSESAARGPRTGATASPVRALEMRRITDARGTRRPAKDAVQPAGRLRQVIHMYCVQICSTTSSCMSWSRANCRISSSVMRTPLQVSYCLACGGSPFIWQRRMPPVFSTRRASRR